jgi:two-component system sensor histidine kinase YesM
MQRLSLVPLYDTGVLSILDKYSRPEFSQTRPSLAELEKMFLYISGLAYNRSEVKGIQIIANNNFLFTNFDSSRMQFYTDVKKQDWYAKVSQADGAWTLIPPHKPDYYMEGDPEVYFSVARFIRDLNTNRILGLIKIDLRLDVFRQILSNVKFEEKCSLSVVNGEDQLFYDESACTQDPLSAKALKETKLPNESFARDVEIGGNRYLTVADYSEYTGLKVISFIPVESLLKDTKKLRDFTANSLAWGITAPSWRTRPFGRFSEIRFILPPVSCPSISSWRLGLPCCSRNPHVVWACSARPFSCRL